MSFCPDRVQRLRAELQRGCASKDAAGHDSTAEEAPQHDGGSHVAAMLVRDNANIEWLTGFENVFDEERAHALWVPTEHAEECQMKLHTDSRYFYAFSRAAKGAPIKVDQDAVSVAEWTRREWESLRETLQQVGEEASRAGGEAGQGNAGALSFAIESSISLLEYRGLEKKVGGPACMTETDRLVVNLRGVKDAGEIAKLKSAQEVTDAAFEHICRFIKPGMTEREIQLELDGFMLRSGAQSLAFPSIVACGDNAASPHAVVSDKKLEAGQCMVMDFGAKRHGYCSDMTRTVFLGAPEGKMKRAWEAIRAANEKVERALRPGMTGKEAHDMAISVIDDAGFAGKMGHGLGHGVGLEIHEQPSLSPRNSAALVPGNVVTVEPGIYIPGEFGMRLEDFGVITEDGFEVFTRSTHDTVIL